MSDGDAADEWHHLDDLALIGRALMFAHRAAEGEDEYWTIVNELQRRGTQQIFDEASRLILANDPPTRRLACDVLGQLGYPQDRPFDDEILPLLARVCVEEEVPVVLASAITAMGHFYRPEPFPYVAAHAKHPDRDVRLAAACAIPSMKDGEWLHPAHPVVTTLMELTTDEDARVRDWATFGLGSQVYVDGVAVRQCLLARLDDLDDDARAEALVGLARRHAPGAVQHVRDALGAEMVHRLAVESAWFLGDPLLAEPLSEIATWWDVDVDLLNNARERCDPARIAEEVTLIRAVLEAAEANEVSIAISSELLSERAGGEVRLVGAGVDAEYSLEALIRRAGGSVDAAIQLFRDDLSLS